MVVEMPSAGKLDARDPMQISSYPWKSEANAGREPDLATHNLSMASGSWVKLAFTRPGCCGANHHNATIASETRRLAPIHRSQPSDHPLSGSIVAQNQDINWRKKDAQDVCPWPMSVHIREPKVFGPLSSIVNVGGRSISNV